MEKSLKDKDVNQSKKWAKIFLGIGLALFAVGIVIFSLLVPPIGAIHTSVVTIFCSTLTFIGGVFGIDSYTKVKSQEQEIDFEIKKRKIEERMTRQRSTKE